MPIEGHHLAFNGRKGPDRDPPVREAALGDARTTTRSWSCAQFRPRRSGSIVPHQPGGHFGGDPLLHRMLFKPGTADPLNQRAGARAGAHVGPVRCRRRARACGRTGRSRSPSWTALPDGAWLDPGRRAMSARAPDGDGRGESPADPGHAGPALAARRRPLRPAAEADRRQASCRKAAGCRPRPRSRRCSAPRGRWCARR